MSKTGAEIVKLAAEFLLQNMDIDNLVIELEKQGASTQEAEQARFFLPMAFTRAFFRDIKLPDYFQLMNPATRQITQYRLSDNPIYKAALELGLNWEAKGFKQDDFSLIMSESSEYNALNLALQHGVKLQGDIKMATSPITAAWDLNQEVIQTEAAKSAPIVKTKAKWWEFWKKMKHLVKPKTNFH